MKPYIFKLPEWLPGFLSGRPIFSYGVMLGLSFLVGWTITLALAEKNGLDKKRSSNTLFWAMVCSIIGARIFYFLENSETFSIANFFSFSKGGLVAYGGYIGGIFGGLFYSLVRRFSFFDIADMVGPQMALGLGITRFGCFLYGCDFGKPKNLLWSVQYPKWDMPDVKEWLGGGAPAFNDHLNKALVSIKTNISSLPIHPTQLYESMAGFIIFSFLFLFLPFRRFKGQVFLLFLILYGIFRFFNEFLRGDPERAKKILGIPFTSPSQFISVILILISIFLWIFLYKKAKIQKIA